MAEFIYIMKQAGEGCDYTIGCGTVAFSIEAPDYEAAFQKIKEDWGWDEYESGDYTSEEITNYLLNGERSLESFVIYEVKDKKESMYDTYVSDLIDRQSGLKEANETAERRKQYESLKKEFE